LFCVNRIEVIMSRPTTLLLHRAGSPPPASVLEALGRVVIAEVRAGQIPLVALLANDRAVVIVDEAHIALARQANPFASPEELVLLGALALAGPLARGKETVVLGGTLGP
jgi:hypothetical protein